MFQETEPDPALLGGLIPQPMAKGGSWAWLKPFTHGADATAKTFPDPDFDACNTAGSTRRGLGHRMGLRGTGSVVAEGQWHGAGLDMAGDKVWGVPSLSQYGSGLKPGQEAS